MFERWQIAAMLETLHLEIKQTEPVIESGLGDEPGIPWWVWSPAQNFGQPPQAPGIKTEDNHSPTRPQHTAGLAHHTMAVSCKIQRMMDQHGIHTVTGQW